MTATDVPDKVCKSRSTDAATYGLALGARERHPPYRRSELEEVGLPLSVSSAGELMLAPFIIEHRAELIAHTRLRSASRRRPTATATELESGIPIFLEQLLEAFRVARGQGEMDHRALDRSASLHGDALFEMGLSVGQVVHDYGDIRQSITELAIEKNTVISSEDFRTLNQCLDDAIAGAVTAYALRRERALAVDATERLGVLAHEQRNHLNIATLSFDAIKTGRVAVGGSTSAMLGRSLIGLGQLIDRSLADVRLDAGIDRHERISVAELTEEVEIGATLQAEARDLKLTVNRLERDVMIEGDRQIVAAAIANLLTNAFKFTPVHGQISLTLQNVDNFVLFNVGDECGGLPEGKADELFQPYSQRGKDRSGLGLGLAIVRRAAEANGGRAHVRDIPGKGCVFTLELPIVAVT